jgi:hypothetical protein
MPGSIMEVIFVVGSTAGLLFLLASALLNVKKLWIMAFTDPHHRNYERKTDKELYAFIIKSCIAAFFIAVISYQIFVYIAVLYWFYFTFFMIMFSRIWKFHDKSRLVLFAILILTTAVSFTAAPLARNILSQAVLSYFSFNFY